MNEHCIQLQHVNITVWVKCKQEIYGLNSFGNYIFHHVSIKASCLSFCCVFSNCSDSLKDSLAVALRHSREQAQTTYDRRTANQKKAAALQFARKKAESAMGREDDGGEQSSRSDDLSNFSVGDFVGLVMEDSTLNNPCVFVGCQATKSLPCDISTRVVHFGGERRWVD